MIILGLNAYHGDSSACIIKDGKLIAAVEEERFRRIKHWAGFPTEAIRYCLAEAKVKIEDIDYVAINRNPKVHLAKKAVFALGRGLSPKLVLNRLMNAARIQSIKQVMIREFGVDEKNIRAEFYNVEHHIAHLASAFLISPFKKAALVSVDGFGDFVGAMWGIGEDKKIQVMDRVFFPHSLGLYYLAFTQYLGFPKYGDEYKVMGLAAYGRPVEIDRMRKIVKLNAEGKFELNLDYFVHHTEGVTMTWDCGEPVLGPVYSKNLELEFGKARKREEPTTKHHENIAASMQAMYEEAFFNLLNYVYAQTKISVLCLAGGCAMNSVANGKIFDRTPFKEVFIQPAAGDAGGALGSAYYVYNHILENERSFVLKNAYWGPSFDNSTIEQLINKTIKQLDNCLIIHISKDDELCERTARYIADGNVVGWFQGRMEWGPRALGNRSILADPRRPDMKDILNARIKRREPFRPFAPSILLENVGEYFEKDYPDPFMIKVYSIKEEKRNIIPAVTHVDGTGRLQTVSKEENPLFWKLIKEFYKFTGVPVLLNTSFNENEPIVCKPEEALDCFLRTKMDVLVLGNWVVKKEY